MKKSRSLLAVSKSLVTSVLVIAIGWSASPTLLADDDASSSGGSSSSQGSPKIELKKSERLQPVQSTITASASASASAFGSASGQGGGQAFGSAMANTSIQAGSRPTTSTPSTGSSRAMSSESVSRSTVKEGDNEITVITAITPRQEITIRQSNEDGIELQLKPRSRSGKADDANNKKAKTYKADSIEDFKTKHAKLYPLLEKYLLSEPQKPVVVAATGNDAQAMATKQIEQMIEQNAGNPQLQDALRQSLEAIRSAQ